MGVQVVHFAGADGRRTTTHSQIKGTFTLFSFLDPTTKQRVSITTVQDRPLGLKGGRVAFNTRVTVTIDANGPGKKVVYDMYAGGTGGVAAATKAISDQHVMVKSSAQAAPHSVWPRSISPGRFREVVTFSVGAEPSTTTHRDPDTACLGNGAACGGATCGYCNVKLHVCFRCSANDGGACGGGETPNHYCAEPAPTTAGGTTTPSGARQVTITQSGSGFQWQMASSTPGVVSGTGNWPTITLLQGDDVTFKGQPGPYHWFAFIAGAAHGGYGNANAIYDQGAANNGKTFTATHTFATTGDYTYYCSPHGNMQGSIRVSAPATTAAPATDTTTGLHCTSVWEGTTDAWCDATCNHVPPVCPDTHCTCVSGGPITTTLTSALVPAPVTLYVSARGGDAWAYLDVGVEYRGNLSAVDGLCDNSLPPCAEGCSTHQPGVCHCTTPPELDLTCDVLESCCERAKDPTFPNNPFLGGDYRSCMEDGYHLNGCCEEDANKEDCCAPSIPQDCRIDDYCDCGRGETCNKKTGFCDPNSPMCGPQGTAPPPVTTTATTTTTTTTTP